MKLLLIEDDPVLRATLVRSLSRRGFAMSTGDDGAQALTLWAQVEPDVVALDLSLPGLDGLEVLARARARGWSAPVLILTARGTVGDRVLGLNAGADDYLPKPFDLDELEARLRALVRRRPGVAQDQGFVTLGGLRLDRVSGAVHHGAQVMELPPRELALLQALMVRPGQAVGKEQLFAQVFPGEPDVQYEAIEVVVYRLRKRLADTGVQLTTLRGLGYLLKETAS